MAVMSLPNAKTLPESGLTRPSAVFSSTVLPLPAAPRITRDSPSKASNERSLSTVHAVERDGDVIEPQNGLRRRRPSAQAWLTKILVINRSRTKISTVAITIACVVARPTPCVPPVVRRP